MDKKKIQEKIFSLKEEKNAIILVHNYQIPEIQDMGDFVGDSLDLAIKATKTQAKNIVFCGVGFMAESAKILNPSKTVIHPDRDSRCPMAAMVDVKGLNLLKKKYPTAKVVSYMNTTSEIKSISDICCTSSNGKKVVNSLGSKKVIFVPDYNLGLYIKRFIKDKEMIIWPGVCSTHHNIKKLQIEELKNQHPSAEILVHPECRPEVIDIADYTFSTNGMVNHVKISKSKEFIIGTEKDICYRLKKANPEKIFFPVETAICQNMKKITLDKLLKSLESLEPKINLSEKIMKNAKIPLERMMCIGRGD